MTQDGPLPDTQLRRERDLTATTNLGTAIQSEIGHPLERQLRRERPQQATTEIRRQEQEQYLYGPQWSAGELD